MYDDESVEQLEALRESEEMYRTFIERSNDGVVVLQDRLVKFVNPRFVEMSGYSAETLLNTAFTDYLTPEEIQLLLDRYERRTAGDDVPSVYETAMTRKGGQKIPLEISAAVVSYEGRPADLVLVRDITERKQAESYLQKYRLLADTTLDIIMFVALDGRILEANHAAVRAYSYSHDDLLELNIRDLRATPGRPMVPGMLKRLRHETLRFESVHVRRDGTTFPVEIQAGATTIDHEEVILGIVRDITERKQAEAALQLALEQAQVHSQHALALQSIAEAGLTMRRLPDLFQLVAETVAKALDVDACCVFVLDEAAEVFEVHAAYNLPGLRGCRVRATEGLIGRVAMEGRPVYVPDAANDPLAYDSCEARAPAKSMLGVPMVARGRVVGVTRVQSLAAREFAEDEVRLLQAIAERAAMAIDNAKLYEELQRSHSEVETALDTERHFSLLLQRALLPAHVSLADGWRLAVRYVPAYASREIGGDFYDAFTAANGRAGVLVGDVSGKGLEAASLAATTRSTVHAFAHGCWATGEVIGRTNQVLSSEQSELGSFVTVFLVIFDTRDGQLCYSSAGHPPAAILRADGSVGFLCGVDPPVGVLRTHEYGQNADELRPGDTLVLYTDGISEARSATEMFDIDGIRRTLEGHSDWTCDEIADRLVAAATEHAGGKLSDDAAVLVVSWQP